MLLRLHQDELVAEDQLKAVLLDARQSLWVHIPMVMLVVLSILLLMLNCLGCAGACLLSYSLLSGTELTDSTGQFLSNSLFQDLQCSCSSALFSMHAWHSGYLLTTWRIRWWTTLWLRRSLTTARVRASLTWSLTQFRGTSSAVASSHQQTGLVASQQAVVWRWRRSASWRMSTAAAAWRWSGTPPPLATRWWSFFYKVSLAAAWQYGWTCW